MINQNFRKLQAGYLFPEIARRVNAFIEKNPTAKDEIIRCGIGDVTEGIAPAAVQAIKTAADELASKQKFRGYGPEQGYDFLREAIVETRYRARGAQIGADEIFVSDGAKCDTANILDIFAKKIRVAISDPVYPVYLDSNVMAGNTGDFNGKSYDDVLLLPCKEEDGFIPQIPNDKEPPQLIYLCSPNNPTGAAADKAQLQDWINYARDCSAVILYDAAYAEFIQDENLHNLPKSIFEIEGADECAIEFNSFSKFAGFTGVRCAWTTIPKKLVVGKAEISLHSLWNRRQATKFNGASYLAQKAAAACLSGEGERQCIELIDGYMKNAGELSRTMRACGARVFGGENAPYVWVSCPRGFDSWQTFDLLLKEARIVCTPGSGFGACGEGYFRLSAFNSAENCHKACQRLSGLQNYF